MNPLAFAEAFGEVRVKLATNIFKGDLVIDLKPFRFSPLDYQAAWNVNDRQDFCYSLSNTREVANIEARIATQVYECTTGLYGWLREDSIRDCLWETYEPMLPAYTINSFSKYDKSKDWKQWGCLNEDGYSQYPDSGDFDDVIIIEGEGVFQDHQTDSF